jgi:serine/threonine-protein kinase RsbW
MLKMVVELTRHIAILNGFSIPEAQKISLAVDEAITNVITHSYKKDEAEKINLEFFSATNGLKIKITFSGIPPTMAEPKVDLDKMIKAKKKGGLGVALMKRIMDSVEYKTIGNINSCEMIKWKREN